MPALSDRIRGIVPGDADGWEVYMRARKMRAKGLPVVMLSIGDHDIPTDPAILDAMDQSARSGNLGYAPIPGSRPLREAIAERVTARGGAPASADNVMVTCGGQGALYAAMTAALNPGDSCVVLDPYYASFAMTVRGAAGVPIIVPTHADDGFQPDAAAIEAALTPQTRAILINSPNNPTGAVYARDRLEAVADLARRCDLWVISDELYDSQVHDGTHLSIRDLPDMAERTFQVGSMSKGFAMTGSRLGWVVAPEFPVVCMIDLAGTTTYGLPGFIQDAALFALTELTGSEAEIAARYRRRRDIAVDVLTGANHVGFVPPEGGMYVMLDIRPTGLSGDEFAERLLDDELIGVMPGESFGAAAAGHIRVAMTVSDEELRDALTRIVSFADRVADQDRSQTG